ncbi:uncharacterized protein LOC114439625 [Parambassis ranga]|uniref:Uncharacterized protein LOC114439625 n=1 Tax=Parambassis ranga TaxID=210632 RepID=A0A6P7IPL1_9TELE|nr:uncharacterized protein LOC114439625 [Parambassis ranga]
MKTRLTHVLVFIQLLEAYAELRHLTEGQSLGLSCSSQQNRSSPESLHLYHRDAQNQTTLLSMAEGDEVRVDPAHRGRLQIFGGLNSPTVNVTISRLQHSDSGLYVFELSYREGNGSDHIISPRRVFLLVDAAGGSCQVSYTTLLLTIFAAVGLLALTLSWMAAQTCGEARRRHRPPPHAPIYEEMSRKQQSPERPQNNRKASTQLEEVHFPVYANPQIRQPQDNYYACPRQLALRA